MTTKLETAQNHINIESILVTTLKKDKGSSPNSNDVEFINIISINDTNQKRL